MFTRKQHFHFHTISISRDRLLQTAHLQSRNLYSLGFSISIRSGTFSKINKDDQWLSSRSPIGDCESVIFKWSKQIVKYCLVLCRKNCRKKSWMAIVWNSPFSSSLWPLNKRSEDAFFTALTSIWSNIFTNSNEKKTCLLLCLLCIFKFQTLTCQNFWIFYFTSRLTLYECVVNVYIQRQFLIRNWTIKQNIFLEIRRNYRAFNATQRKVLCCFLCCPFQLPSCVLSCLLIFFLLQLLLLQGYNNILFLVAPLRTGRHLIKKLFKVNIVLHIFC